MDDCEELRKALISWFGEGPRFEVKRNNYQSMIPNSWGYYVSYIKGTVTMAEVREVVDEVSPDHGVILNERGS